MTAKEKLYARVHDKVARLINNGYSLTAARIVVSGETGLSYNTVIHITLDLNSARKCESCKAE
ncbi:MAG: hypothetical protein IKJ78_05935 [Bacteroidales bacterium]|nr:hypothetical protein [Bacteroidales bacterium]